MDYAASHVLYVDNRVSGDLDGKHLQRPSDDLQSGAHGRSDGASSESLQAILGEIEEVRTSLQNILSVFNGVHTCISGASCVERMKHVDRQSANDLPMLVILGTAAEDEVEQPLPNTVQELSTSLAPTDSRSKTLLEHICDEISKSTLSKRVVPITMIYSAHIGPVVGGPSVTTTMKETSRSSPHGLSRSACSVPAISGNVISEPHRVLKYVDLGAVEVLPSPLPEDRLQGLVVHAHRAHKEVLRERLDRIEKKKARKTSWLGNNDKRPYAYLREKMVSELMTGICSPDEVLHNVDHKTLRKLDLARENHLKNALGSWAFSGHEFDDDELVYAATFMLQHALQQRDLERFTLPEDDLRTFVKASRAAYNSFVNYHNFRHVIDVMQAIFCFLIHLGTLPPFPIPKAPARSYGEVSPIAALLRPLDALTLLITAIGHDVGHPGVNNAFLVSLNAPLAQLYNDKSVLEAFHCAAYSQILRRYWTATFDDTKMRALMINSILATDMGVHMKYMSDLGNLQEKLHHNKGTAGWAPQALEEYRILTCALLIKCADISNVARPFDIALKWADSLQLEFANQGHMEKEVGIPTTLFGGPPELGNLIKLGNSQNSFINIFARPLFEAVTDILPAMAFAVDEMKENQQRWTSRIKKEEAQQSPREREGSQVMRSPRSMSPNWIANPPESSHPEGLPASNAQSPPLGAADRPKAADTSDSRKSSASIYHLAATDSNLMGTDGSRRSSSGQHFSNAHAFPDSVVSPSRRSSGALSAANTSHGLTMARRTSNASPSQLQLGTDLISQTSSPTTNTENEQPNGHASDDTLSQACFAKEVSANGIERKDSINSSGGGDPTGRKIIGSDPFRSVQSSTSQASGRPYAHSGRHRSSSGAHTTNTNLSQTTPYSPTGTQATSVLTMSSEDNLSQNRVDNANSPQTQDAPLASGNTHGIITSMGLDGAHDMKDRTRVIHNGNVRSSSSLGYKSLGRKGSRPFFQFFKKTRKGIEASP